MYLYYVKEKILESLPKQTLTLHTFCTQYPNVVCFGVLEPTFTWQQENMNSQCNSLTYYRHLSVQNQRVMFSVTAPN